MPNLGDLKALIASDLRRSNLGPEIANAIPDAIRDHETERFWWNETYPTPYTLTIHPAGRVTTLTSDIVFQPSVFQAGGVFQVNPVITHLIDPTGGDVYPIVPQGQIQEFIKIDAVRANQSADSGGTWYTVTPSDWITIEDYYSTSSSGEPSRWAYRNNYLRIYPLPPRDFPLRIFGHYRATPLVDDSDSNVWTNQGRNLIRYTVLKRLYSYPIRDAQQVANAEQAGERALDYLRRETDRRVRQGRMRAYYG